MNRRMNLVIGFLLGTVVALVAAFAVTATGNLRSYQDDIGSVPTPGVIIDEETVNRTVPDLASDQRQQAIDMAINDPNVTQILGSQPYQVANVEPWTEGPNLVGGVVRLNFAKPATVAGQWITLSWNCADRTMPPRQVPYTATFSDLQFILVFSDLLHGKVSQILPGYGGQLLGEEIFAPGITPPSKCED